MVLFTEGFQIRPVDAGNLQMYDFYIASCGKLVQQFIVSEFETILFCYSRIGNLAELFMWIKSILSKKVLLYPV